MKRWKGKRIGPRLRPPQCSRSGNGQTSQSRRRAITNANPRLFKKYNYRVVWADTAKGPTSLRVENYAHGSDAALDSWVVLERKEGGAGGAE